MASKPKQQPAEELPEDETAFLSDEQFAAIAAEALAESSTTTGS